MDYKGWSNYETWNIALWITNDYALYKLALRAKNYPGFVAKMAKKGVFETPDGVHLWDEKVNVKELADIWEVMLDEVS